MRCTELALMPTRAGGHRHRRPVRGLVGRWREREGHHAFGIFGPKQWDAVLSRNSASAPASMRRSCQRQTVVWRPRLRARFRQCLPSAFGDYFARQTCFYSPLRSARITISRSRSAAVTKMLIPARMSRLAHHAR